MKLLKYGMNLEAIWNGVSLNITQRSGGDACGGQCNDFREESGGTRFTFIHRTT